MQKTTRREFVKTAAAAAVVSQMPSMLKAQQAPSMNVIGANDRIRVACVGYSDRFRTALFGSFCHARETRNAEIVAVADLWKKRLYENAKPELEKVLGHKVDTYTSDEQLYAEAKDIDAVIISTADFQHARHAANAVNAGKDVYCEKPLAEDMLSANLILDAVNAKRKAGWAPGAVLQIGSQRRSGAWYQAAKEWFTKPEFGDLCFANLTYNVNQSRRWRRDDALIASCREEDVDWKKWLLDRPYVKFDPKKYLEFRLYWPYSSGIPGQWMCHSIDTISWYTGIPYPTSCVASGGLYQWADGRQSFDTYAATFEYGESGVKGKGFQVQFNSHMTNADCGVQDRYYSTKGCIDMGDGTFSNKGVEGAKPFSKQLTDVRDDNPAGYRQKYGNSGDVITARHMANWIDCMRSRKDPVAPVEAGYNHSIALIMANASARGGGRATFDPVKRQVMVNGKPFLGYESTELGFFDKLFA